MKFLDNNNIELNKDLSELDLFTIDFIKSIKDYTDYVIISGYVSILLGRARASEDIDIIIPRLDNATLNKMILNLQRNNFYCLNSSSIEEMIDILNDNLAIRFAKNNEIIPNMEMKFSKNNIDKFALKDKISVMINNNKIFISNIELQIAFKEIILKSPKDLEDALHLRNITKDNLNKEKLKYYEGVLSEFC